MKLSAEEYLRAAQEHFAELQILTSEEVRHYPLAYYLAGVTVECLFRAYMALVEAPFDDKHDLRKLAESGKFLEFMPDSEKDSIQGALVDVFVRWSNSFRYCCTTSLRTELNKRELFRNGNQYYSGDILKPNWKILYNGVDLLMKTGVGRWQNSKQKWNR